MYRVLYGEELLHDPRTDSALLGDLQLEQNQNECGYCEFTIYPDHPLHGTLKERDMANQIRVFDDEALLFQGFIYELGRDFQTSGTVKCKGDLALLECSIVRPYSTLEGVYETTAPNNVDGYFRWLIEQHNEQVEQEKRFVIGMNEGSLLDKNNYIFRESKQLPTTAEEIEGKILNDLGGYIRVRYPGGVRTIDLMAECYDANTQIFDFGVNLMDYQETTDALEMFTALVLQGATPEGEELPLTVESLEDGIYAKDTGFSKRGDLVYSHSAVERYGWIVGTYENSDIATAEGLLDAGVMALKACVSPIKTIEVKAIDLSIINKDYKPVQVGEYVRVRSAVHGFDSYMLCTSIAPNLVNPEDSLYTLGMTFDSFTGIQNKRINALNASITKNYERTEAISAEAKAAANQAAIAGATAEAAQAQAEAAQIKADEAKEQADAAATSAGEATTAAANAQSAANEAAQAAIDADAKALAAQAAVDKVETTVETMQTDVSNAQSKAEAAQQEAAQAVSKATEAEEAVKSATDKANAAQEAAEAAQTAAGSATDKAEAAQTAAGEAKTQAADASTTAAAAKLDAEQANKDIAALGEELETVSNTMTADYARKTDLTEATASLQSQITQNAGQITSTVSKLAEVDETANDAKDKAEAAQSAASTAQSAADAATADAAAAQTKADEAAAAAATAQSNADTASAAAAAAQAKADKAAADLTEAENNLANVTSRVDSTEEDIAAAQQAVTDAQAAADKAQADATEAATKAANAQTEASSAATAASNAQTKANEAAAAAATAQETADKAQGDATAAKAAADQAAADAAAAQSTADTAKANAQTAQTKADQAAATAAAAQTAADEADAKAAQAAADLATAEQNLADVTSRVDATEEEIEAAQAAVETAQAAADKAKSDAAAAQSTANTAKANAATAQTAANNAKAAADAAQADADAAKDAADKAQADVDALAVRVTTAETKITQNSEAIELRATKKEVTQTLGGYYTKSETEAKITEKADSITSTVSSTYATKQEVEDIEIGGRNLLRNSTSFYVYGVANGITGEITEEGYLRFVAESGNENWASVRLGNKYEQVENELSEGDEFVISFVMRSPDTTTLPSVYIKQGMGYYPLTGSLSDKWSVVYYAGTWKDANSITPHFGFSNRAGTYEIKSCKIERGNKATDWTLAPEEVESGIDVAQSTADHAEEVNAILEERVVMAESVIKQLSDCISMLVVDGTGASLMTQTDEGWQFSIGSIQDALDKASSDLNSLTGTVGSVESAVGVLETAVADLGEIAEYVTIGTYYNEETGNNEPCIELGESDSDFKLLITNTRIMFTEGSGTPTYIKDNTLVTNNVEIKDELRQSSPDVSGYWVWSTRSNGNYGLAWRE